jgi:hypothetical protein
MKWTIPVIAAMAVALPLVLGAAPAAAVSCDTAIHSAETCKMFAKEDAEHKKYMAELTRKRAARPAGWYENEAWNHCEKPSEDAIVVVQRMKAEGTLAWDRVYVADDGTVASILVVGSSGRIRHFWNGPDRCDDAAH